MSVSHRENRVRISFVHRLGTGVRAGHPVSQICKNKCSHRSVHTLWTIVHRQSTNLGKPPKRKTKEGVRVD